MARASEEGQTLVEVLVSIVLLSVALAGVLAAVTAGTTLSGDHRDDARARVALLDLAETVKSVPYRELGTAAQYETAVRGAGYTGAGTVVSVACWKRPSVLSGVPRVLSLDDFGTCTAPDTGLQLVRLRVVAGGRTQDLDVVTRRTT